MTYPLNQGSFGPQDVTALLAGDVVPLAASGAIDPTKPNVYEITKAGVAALTLAAPVAGTTDNMQLLIFSTTANAHTITATGLFQDGAGHVNTATFSANAGASISLMAYKGKWVVLGLQGVTMS